MIDERHREFYGNTEYRELLTQRKTVSYPLTTMNGSTLNGEKADEEVEVKLLIDGLRERITFDVIDLINHNVILGLSWLRKHNSIID
jgi:hypothetical protein